MLRHMIFTNSKLKEEFFRSFDLTEEKNKEKELKKELNFIEELISGPLNKSATGNDNKVS